MRLALLEHLDERKITRRVGRRTNKILNQVPDHTVEQHDPVDLRDKMPRRANNDVKRLGTVLLAGAVAGIRL